MAESVYANVEACIAARPASFTHERAMSILPAMEINPEWKRKKDAGELPEGWRGIVGSMRTVWPDSRLTPEEAKWILAMSEFGSMRWLADAVLDDSNQIFGGWLIEAAEAVSKGEEPHP